MESIKRISEIASDDRAVLERLFGVPLEPSAAVVLIQKAADVEPVSPVAASEDEIPEWFNVLDGLSEEDVVDFLATLDAPVRLARAI